MRFFLTCAVAAILSCVVVNSARGGDVPHEISQPYGPALEKLKSLYTRCTIEGKLNQTLGQEHKRRQQTFTYRGAGSQLRLDLTPLVRQDGIKQPGTTTTIMASPDYSLEASRGAKSAHFDTATEDGYAQAAAGIERTMPLQYVYGFNSKTSYLEMLKQSSIQNLTVEHIRNDDQPMVKIRYREMDSQGETHSHWDSWILLSPGEGWALREFSRTSGQGASLRVLRGTISYDGEQNGVPFIKRLATWEERGEQRKSVWHNVIEVTGFNPGSASQYYFTAPSL